MAEIVWVDQVDDCALRAACRAALGDPSALPWTQAEIDQVRETIAAYLEAVVLGDG